MEYKVKIDFRGLTNRSGKKPIATMKIPIRICGRIMAEETSVTSLQASDLGEPRNIIPNIFVKQKIARPPIKVSPMMENRIVTSTYTPPVWSPFSIPV